MDGTITYAKPLYPIPDNCKEWNTKLQPYDQIKHSDIKKEINWDPFDDGNKTVQSHQYSPHEVDLQYIPGTGWYFLVFLLIMFRFFKKKKRESDMPLLCQPCPIVVTIATPPKLVHGDTSQIRAIKDAQIV